MEHKLALEVFRFDCKTDYLPYYKKVYLKISDNKRVADLLSAIKEDESSFSFPVGKNAAIKINNKALNTSEKIKDIVEHFGKSLKLEPLSTKRSEKDLSINEDDFNKKFDLLGAFVDGSDRSIYKSYIKEYYSSPIVNIEEDFIGDGLFAFAYDMLHKYPQRETQILKTIAKKESGVWLHVNISNRIYPTDTQLERKVVYIKNAILNNHDIEDYFIQKQRNLSKVI